ncbi:GbsR/MarR family transcriptional regulator [Glaciecola sp. SC05]|uniref:GbsR/MarR family transcriptional regulator n=1 Tax=Glaciecola sp. SC05 TaxID=1987355 RepID=UPI0035272149
MDKAAQVTIDDFIEKMGLIAQADGIPRIAGKVLAALVIYDEPFSFSQLSELLQVSRGSISTNTRVLVNLGIIERTTKRGERQDYFKLKESPYVSLMQGIQTRTAHTARVISETKQRLPAELSGAQQRLTEMQQFYLKLNRTIKSLT